MLHETMNAQIDTITKFLKHLSTKISDMDTAVNKCITKAIKDATASISQSVFVQADDAVRERVTKFAMENLKDYTNKDLPMQLQANDVAFVDSIGKVKEDVRMLEDKVKS